VPSQNIPEPVKVSPNANPRDILRDIVHYCKMWGAYGGGGVPHFELQDRLFKFPVQKGNRTAYATIAEHEWLTSNTDQRMALIGLRIKAALSSH